MASIASILPSPLMSPASRLIVGLEVVPPSVNVTGPSALRKPAAVARMVYVPAGAERLNVPSVGLAVTDSTTVVPFNRLTVTGFDARTFPVTVPSAGKGVEVGVDVAVEVAVDVAVVVAVAVAVSVEGVELVVGVLVGVEVGGVPVTVGVAVTVDVGGVPVTVGVEVGGVPVTVGVEVAVEVGGVPVTVGVAVSVGVDVGGVTVPVDVAVEVGVIISVGRTVRLAPVDVICVRPPVPLETITVQLIVA